MTSDLSRLNSLVVDFHVCLPEENQPAYFERLFRYRAAGVDWISVNLADAQVPLEVLIRRAADLRRWIAMNPERCLLAARKEDLQAAKNSGRLAITFDVEGGYAIGHDAAVVQLIYDLGVRVMLMVYNHVNRTGCG